MPPDAPRASACRRLLAAVLLCCAVARPAQPADAPAAPNARATLVWLIRAPAPGSAAADPLDIAALAPALARQGIAVRTVTDDAPGSLRAAVAGVLHAAGSRAPPVHRIAVGAAGDAAAAVLAFAHDTPAVTGIVIVEPGVPARLAGGQTLATAFGLPGAQRSAEPARVPLLQVFDARCEDAGERSPAPTATVDAWLQARWGAVHAEARAAYAPLANARVQCRALRDARFVDGAHARARATAMSPDGPATWLALREDDLPATPPAAALPANTLADGRAAALAARTLTSTFADYLAAFIASGDPAVRGRPHWPAFDDGARRYLQLGSTVRTTRDPLIDVLDLQAALDAAASPAAGTTAHAASPAIAPPPVSSATLSPPTARPLP